MAYKPWLIVTVDCYTFLFHQKHALNKPCSLSSMGYNTVPTSLAAKESLYCLIKLFYFIFSYGKGTCQNSNMLVNEV